MNTIKIFEEGGNIYAQQKFYNYSPLYFYILGLIGIIRHNIFPYSTLAFCIRAFISLIDVGIMMVLMKIALIKKISVIRTAAMFFLNPVSMIISGKHGQFDNITILLLLIVIYFLIKKDKKGSIGTFMLWFILTLALLIKHIIVFQFGLLMFRITKNKFFSILMLIISLTIFFSSFIPYWEHGKENITISVFKYGGIAGSYGVSSILNSICGKCVIRSLSLIYLYKYIFMLTSLLFMGLLIVIESDIIWSVLISFLFFLTFASGIGGQYFILPIAIASLRPNKMYFLYTIITSLFLLGNKYELNIHYFNFVSWNLIWLVAIIWFIYEIKSNIGFFHRLKKENIMKALLEFFPIDK